MGCGPETDGGRPRDAPGVLGAQYAETYPRRTHALVLESVLDHSSPTARTFLDEQAARPGRTAGG